MMYEYGEGMMQNWFFGGVLAYLIVVNFLILGIAYFIKELFKDKK